MIGRIRARLADDDDGFTLIELVVSVAIMGIITVALVGVVLSYLRTTVDSQARLTESHDVQFAAAYWQRDVASIGVRSTTYDSGPAHTFPLQQSVGLPACPLPANAAAIVTLAWSDYTTLTSTDTPATVKVTYATTQAGGVFALLRIRCGSLPSTVPDTLANTLAAVPTVTCQDASGAAIACTGAGGNVPAVVKLALTVHDSSGGGNLPTYVATLTGQRRQS